ncbi:MAG: hypothetical protein AAF234_16130 [Pseudomonadota bacterium]
MSTRPNVKLGDKAKDAVTGFKGIIVAISEHISGCRTVGLQPKTGKDGTIPECQWFDVERVKVLKPAAVKVTCAPTGGPIRASEHPPVR